MSSWDTKEGNNKGKMDSWWWNKGFWLKYPRNTFMIFKIDFWPFPFKEFCVSQSVLEIILYTLGSLRVKTIVVSQLIPNLLQLTFFQQWFTTLKSVKLLKSQNKTAPTAFVVRETHKLLYAKPINNMTSQLLWQDKD